MRYECQSCGYRFNEPAVHRERRTDYGAEEIAGCPACGGGYIEIPAEHAACSWDDLFLEMRAKGWNSKMAYHIVDRLAAQFNYPGVPSRAAQIVVECIPERQETSA